MQLSNAAFEADAEQFPRFHGELHRQDVVNFFAEAVDNHVDRVFGRQPALSEVVNLVFAHFGR